MVEQIEDKGSEMGSSKALFDKKIWSIKDVSEFLGLSTGTIYNKTSRRELPYRKRGNRLFFIPDEILNWIEEGD